MEQYFIGCYWSERKTDEDYAVEIILKILKLLMIESDTQNMFYKGVSKKLDKAKVQIEKENIKGHLMRNKRDFDKTVIEELGYSFSCWNGNNQKPIELSILLGSYQNKILNNVVINYSVGFDVNNQSYTYFETVLRRTIEIVDPDIGIFTSHEYNNKLGNGYPIDQGGYITYKKGKYEYREEYKEKIRPTTAST